MELVLADGMAVVVVDAAAGNYPAVGAVVDKGLVVVGVVGKYLVVVGIAGKGLAADDVAGMGSNLQHILAMARRNSLEPASLSYSFSSCRL